MNILNVYYILTSYPKNKDDCSFSPLVIKITFLYNVSSQFELMDNLALRKLY